MAARVSFHLGWSSVWKAKSWSLQMSAARSSWLVVSIPAFGKKKGAGAHGTTSSVLTDTMAAAPGHWLREWGLMWLICTALGSLGESYWEENRTKKQQAQSQAWRVQGYQILGGLGLLLLEGSIQKGLTHWQRAQWVWGFFPKPPSLKGFIQPWLQMLQNKRNRNFLNI